MSYALAKKPEDFLLCAEKNLQEALLVQSLSNQGGKQCTAERFITAHSRRR